MTTTFLSTFIICDYATQDIKQKYILAGVYSGDIVVDAFPARLNVSIYIEYKMPDAGDHRITLILYLDEQRLGKVEAVAEHAKAGQVGVVLLPGLEIGADRDTVLRVEGSLNGAEAVEVARKVIRGKAVTEPTASPPPS